MNLEKEELEVVKMENKELGTPAVFLVHGGLKVEVVSSVQALRRTEFLDYHWDL